MKNKVSLALVTLTVCSAITPAFAQGSQLWRVSAEMIARRGEVAALKSSAREIASTRSIQTMYEAGLKASLPARMDLVKNPTLLPAKSTVTAFRDPSFLPAQKTYHAPAISRQEAVTKQLLLNDALQFIENHTPRAGMQEVGRHYYILHSPASFQTVYNRFATAVINQNLGMKQAAIIRKGILLGQPLETVEANLKALEAFNEAHPVQLPQMEEELDRLFIFNDWLTAQNSQFGSPVRGTFDGQAKQEILSEVSERCHHWENQINKYYKQLEQLPPQSAQAMELTKELTNAFSKYERAIASWAFVREGILKNIPASQLKALLFSYQRSLFENANTSAFLL